MTKRMGRFLFLAVMAAAILTISTTPATADDSKDSASKHPIEKLDTAINLIPADAALYSSMLRGREQIEAIASSNAWEKFTQIPFVQMGWQLYERQAANEASGPGKVNRVLKDPQVQELLALLGEMFSDEAFIYADADVIDAIELFKQLNNVNRFAPLMQHLGNDSQYINPQQAQAKMILAVLAKNHKLLKVPSVMMGFKIKDTQRAIAHLGKLDMIAGIALAQNPDLAEVYKRVKLGEGSFSTFTFTGEMIPWHELPMDQLDDENGSGDLKKVVEQIKQEKLVLALGLRGDYLIFLVGPSTEALEKLGDGELLADRPEIKRLGRFADKPVTGIAYISEDFNRCIAGGRDDLDELLKVVDTVLPQLGLDEADQKQIRKDAAALVEDIKPFMPQPGAIAGISFSSERGIEEYYFDWGKYPSLDGSKPLSILRHIGGSPLLAIVARNKVSPNEYDLLVKWVRVAYGYVEKFALPQMDQDDREQFDELAKALGPLVARWDKINREQLIPATADGQGAFVLDAKMMTKQIHVSVTASEEPRPMVEPAIVIGISDKDSFREAITQYWALLGDVKSAMSETLPDVPDVDLPEPKVEQTEVGEIFSIELPKEAGVDEQIGLYLGLNKSVAVLCLNEAHTRRLLADTSLSVGGVLADANRPRAKAVAFNWPDTLTAAMPWIKVGIKQAASRFMSPEHANAQLQKLEPQIATLVDVLSVVRGITSESYMEDGVIVTHTLTEIRDLK